MKRLSPAITIATGTVALTLSLLFAQVGPCRAATASLGRSLEKPVAESIGIRRQTQEELERWQQEREKLLDHYDRLTASRRLLEEEQRLLVDRTGATRERIADKERQLADIAAMQREISPLIDQLLGDLDAHLEASLPYLVEERRNRLDRLRELAADPLVTVNEKFRKVMEALLVETEYSNTVEVYQQNIVIDQRESLVNIFRLGSLALFFQTLDRSSCGFFNVAEAAWQQLPAAANRTITTAIDIGGKRRPAELLAIPLGRIILP
jgi:hypothetical protein